MAVSKVIVWPLEIRTLSLAAGTLPVDQVFDSDHEPLADACYRRPRAKIGNTLRNAADSRRMIVNILCCREHRPESENQNEADDLGIHVCDTLHLIFKEAAMRRAFLQIVVIGVLLAGAASIVIKAQGNPEAAKVKNPVAVTPESIATGKQIYTRYCATCHGTSGQGGSGSDISPPAPNLTDDEWKRGSTDGEIFDVIKNGVPPELNMEPWGDRIKDEDIWNVVNYVRSLAKKK